MTAHVISVPELTATIKEIVRKVVDAERFGGGFRTYHETAVVELLKLHQPQYQRVAEALKVAAERTELATELQLNVNELETRQQAHLELIRKLTHELPYSNELDDCRSARAALIARVGTLRAALREACTTAARIATDFGVAPGRADLDRLDSMLRLAAET